MSSNSEDSLVTSLREIKNPQGSLHFLLSTHVSPATHKTAPLLFQKNKTKQEKYNTQHTWKNHRRSRSPSLSFWDVKFTILFRHREGKGQTLGGSSRLCHPDAVQRVIHSYTLTYTRGKYTAWRMLIFQRSGFVCILSKSYSYNNKEMINRQFPKDTPLTSHLDKEIENLPYKG